MHKSGKVLGSELVVIVTFLTMCTLQRSMTQTSCVQSRHAMSLQYDRVSCLPLGNLKVPDKRGSLYLFCFDLAATKRSRKPSVILSVKVIHLSCVSGVKLGDALGCV